MKLMRRCLVLALAALGLAGSGFAPSAQAAAGDPFVKACRTSVNSAALAGCVPNVRGLTDGAALSPDGRQLYVSTSASGAGTFNGIQQYNRDGAGSAGPGRLLVGRGLRGMHDGRGPRPRTRHALQPRRQDALRRSVQQPLRAQPQHHTGALNQVGACFGGAAGCTGITAGNDALGVAVTDSHVYLRGTTHSRSSTASATARSRRARATSKDAPQGCTDASGSEGSGLQDGGLV